MVMLRGRLTTVPVFVAILATVVFAKFSATLVVFATGTVSFRIAAFVVMLSGAVTFVVKVVLLTEGPAGWTKTAVSPSALVYTSVS